MKSFLIRAILFTAINTGIALAWLYFVATPVLHPGLRNWETEYNMRLMPRNTHFDLVLLGNSRARTISRLRKNHLEVERILGRRVLNLGRGGGSGVVPAKVYMSMYYDYGNSADIVAYMLEPYIFYSSRFNEANPFFKPEPFSLVFWWTLLRNGVYKKELLHYARDQFGLQRNYNKAELKEKFWNKYLSSSLLSLDVETIKDRVDYLYQDGLDEKLFRRYSEKLEELVKMVRSHEGKMVLVVSPTLLGEEPGYKSFIKMLEKLKELYGVAFCDFSGAMPDPKLFYHVDHLNSRGVVFFAEHLLKPALDKAGDVTQ